MFTAPIQRQQDNFSGQRKEADVVSDKIVDEYEEDFEGIEESSRLKNLGKNKKGGYGEEESSGGFNEKYDEDFF